jgi:hypothetical protein
VCADCKENGNTGTLRPYPAGTSGLIKLKITPHKIYFIHLF